jgi:antitoxin (DNA-binding transcriptional repressor) of toxin-antitoxin stability system
MKATIVDLRYKTRDILQALERNESVTILYHGKVKGVITPAGRPPAGDLRNHPLFGLRRDETGSVQDEMDQLRKPRHDL